MTMYIVYGEKPINMFDLPMMKEFILVPTASADGEENLANLARLYRDTTAPPPNLLLSHSEAIPPNHAAQIRNSFGGSWITDHRTFEHLDLDCGDLIFVVDSKGDLTQHWTKRKSLIIAVTCITCLAMSIR